MTTSSTSSMEFIDTALFSSPSILSYNNPSQKSLIRNHLHELLHNFPSFTPSKDTFFHFDGNSKELLNVSGLLHVSKFLPDVHVTIWVHENYPLMAPMVYIISNPDCKIHKNHPFIDKSGFVAPFYMNWDQRSNLNELVQELNNLFLQDHPSMPSSVLKVTLLEDLETKICNDVALINLQRRDAIERWSERQVEVRKKGDLMDGMIAKLQDERDNLEIRVIELRNYNDKLMEWVKRSSFKMNLVQGLMFEDLFEVVDEKSKVVLDCMAEDNALDDVIYALDKGLEEQVMNLDVYMKQVRMLARQQFFQRAMLMHLNVPPRFPKI